MTVYGKTNPGAHRDGATRGELRQSQRRRCRKHTLDSAVMKASGRSAVAVHQSPHSAPQASNSISPLCLIRVNSDLHAMVCRYTNAPLWNPVANTSALSPSSCVFCRWSRFAGFFSLPLFHRRLRNLSFIGWANSIPIGPSPTGLLPLPDPRLPGLPGPPPL